MVSRWIWFLGLLCLALPTLRHSARIEELETARKGWGPVEYVDVSLHPDRYARDWKPGHGVYDHSLPMRALVGLQRDFGVPAETALPWYVCIQLASAAAAIAYLAHVLFDDALVTTLCVAVVFVSPAAGVNLARFGLGFFKPIGVSITLWYGFGHVFRFLTLAFLLRGRFLLMALCLILTLKTHFTMGVFTGCILLWALTQLPRAEWNLRLVAGLGAVGLVAADHARTILSTAALNTGAMDPDVWLTLMKIQNYHWFPAEIETYGINAHTHLVPVVLTLTAFLLALVPADLASTRVRMLLAGSTCALTMTMLGLFAASYWPVPLLIKLALHRACEIVTFLGVLFLVRAYTRVASEAPIPLATLAAAGIALLFLGDPGVPILALLTLYAVGLRAGHVGPIELTGRRRRAAWIVLMVVCAAGAAAWFLNARAAAGVSWAISARGSLWPPFTMLNPNSEPDFLIRGGTLRPEVSWPAIALVAAAFFVAVRGAKRSSPLRQAAIAAIWMLGIALVDRAHDATATAWLGVNAAPAKSYLECQLWVRDHTPEGALFLLNPASESGFRAYSRRPIFGGYREWLHEALCYTPDGDVYAEAMARAKLFGADVDAAVARTRAEGRGLKFADEKLRTAVRESFRKLDAPALETLAKRYGLDYLATDRATVPAGASRYEQVYQNNHYVVFDLRRPRNP